MVVERQLPPLKPSRGHDGTPLDELRIARSSSRNSLLRERLKLAQQRPYRCKIRRWA